MTTAMKWKVLSEFVVTGHLKGNSLVGIVPASGGSFGLDDAKLLEESARSRLLTQRGDSRVPTPLKISSLTGTATAAT